MRFSVDLQTVPIERKRERRVNERERERESCQAAERRARSTHTHAISGVSFVAEDGVRVAYPVSFTTASAASLAANVPVVLHIFNRKSLSVFQPLQLGQNS